MRKNKDKRNRNKFILFILFIITIILLILSLIGCNQYHKNKDRQLLLSLPRLNNEGYWIDKDNNKLTDKLSTYKDMNIYDYYKIYDSQYNKSYNNFYNEFNHNNLDYTYKVEFYDFDYSLYDSKDYKLLNKLVFPKNPNKEGYIFKGWKLKDNPLNKDLIFTDKNTLLVDNNLKFESIFIKSIPQYNEYVKVEFYVDNKIFHQSIIKNGDKINEIEAPNKENYKFLGWYDEFDNKFNFNSNITRDFKLKAKYFNLNSYNNSIKKHDVNYLDEYGNIYQTIEVENFGKANNIPGKTKVGYHFVRWLEEDSLLPFDFNTQIIKNTNLKPEYEINKYLVQFAGAGINNLPDSFIDVPHGTVLTEPDVAAMNKEGYTFTGKFFDQDGNEFKFSVTEVTKDLTLTPEFIVTKYTITWKNDDGTVLKTEQVEHGQTPVFGLANPTKPSTASKTYTFAGWDIPITAASADKIYTATYTETNRKYTITWNNHDGSEISHEEVGYGVTPVFTGTTPTKPSTASKTYTFAGWDPALTPVDGDKAYTAKFTEANRKYTITWRNYDGTTLLSEQVEYGTMPAFTGTAPTKPSTAQYNYTFEKWSPDLVNVTGDATYTAVFKTNINKFSINFVGAGISGLPSTINNIDYGTSPAQPDVTSMSKPHHHFVNKFIDQDGNEFIFGTTLVKKDLTLTPVFEINKYTVKFKQNPKFNNIPDDITNIVHGSKVPLPTPYNLTCNDPAYDFEGLFYTEGGVEKEFKFNDTVVEHDIELTIKAKLNRHKVDIYDHNNTLISSNMYNHNSYISLKKYTNDYVYDYYYNNDDTSEKYYANLDEDNYKFKVTKPIVLKVKAHKKFIKYNINDSNIKLTNQLGGLLSSNIVHVETGKPIFLAKVKKDNYYRIKSIVWQYKDSGGLYHDYNETVYSHKFDTNLYLKDESDIFDNVFLYQDNGSYISISGLNNDYKTIEDFDLNIPATINDKIIKTIGGLQNLSKIRDVILPDSVEEILDACFLGSNLKSINLENSKVIKIKANAFSICKKLLNIKVNPECNMIGNNAFNECTNLETIDLSLSQITTINQSSFSGCTKVTDVKLPTNLKKIKNFGFNRLNKLININLENTKVEEIGKYAFNGCNELLNIKLPSTCSSIDAYSFNECYKVQTIDLLNTQLETIPKHAFGECNNVTDILLPNSLKFIESQAFVRPRKLVNLNLENTQIEEIGEEAFYQPYQLLNIKLPSTCKNLGNRAFAYCTNVKKIDLSATTILKIPRNCFADCNNVTDIKLPNSLKFIESQAFIRPKKLVNLNLENTQVEDIGIQAFYQPEELLNIKLPSTCKTIRKEAFAYCFKVKKIDLLSTQIKTIEKFSFSDCNNVTDILLPNCLKSIQDGAFVRPKKLVNLNLENTQVEDIGIQAFYQPFEILNIKLPSTCKTIGQEAFAYCEKAKKIDLSLTQIKLLPQRVFRDCLNVEEIILPSSLENIEEIVFSKCNPAIFNKIIFKGSKASFIAIIKHHQWISNISVLNPLIEFNDGSSCHYNDL